MAITIPTRPDPRYTIEIELDSVNFVLGFEFNDRLGAWFLDVFDQAGTPLLTSLRIVVGFPMWNRYRNPALPLGDLCAIDTSGVGLDPGFADLGSRVVLLYTPVVELPVGAVVKT